MGKSLNDYTKDILIEVMARSMWQQTGTHVPTYIKSTPQTIVH